MPHCKRFRMELLEGGGKKKDIAESELFICCNFKPGGNTEGEMTEGNRRNPSSMLLT